jgi:hypothetical protein
MPNPHKDRIIELRKSGASPAAIRAKLGLSRGVVCGVLFRAGLTDPTTDKSWDTPRPRARGPQNIHNATVSEDTVRAIRAEYLPFHPTRGGSALAKRFGVATRNVYRIAAGETWAHVQ